MLIPVQIIHSPITEAGAAIMRTFTLIFGVVVFLAGTVLATPDVSESEGLPVVVNPECKEKPCEVKCPENSSWGAGNFCTDACNISEEFCTWMKRCGCFCNKGFKRSRASNKCVPEDECCATRALPSRWFRFNKMWFDPWKWLDYDDLFFLITELKISHHFYGKMRHCLFILFGI